MANWPISRLPAAALLCILALVPNPARAEAIDLFLPATPAEAAAAPAPSGGAVRERLAAINTGALAALPSSPSGQNAGTELRIGLFPGVTAVFPVSEAKPAFGGGAIIHAKSGEDDETTLVVAEGRVTGRVLFRGKTYRIRPTSSRLHAIAEMSRALLPPVAPEVRSPKQGRAAPSAVPAAPANAEPAEIDALFVYTKKAKRGTADILAEINFAVAITNEAYEASGVLMRMRLVGVMQSGTYDEDAQDDYNAGLRDVAGFGEQKAAFAATRKQRDKLGADLVVLVREGGGYCGVGYVNEDPADAQAEAYAYSVTSRWCIVYDTVAHETGHNMGLHHDRYVTDPAPDTQYNFGYVSLPARAMDLMAYENRCWDAGLSCEYKRLFSNPGLTVNGRRFGVPPGRPGAAHGVRWLNEVRGDVKRWRPTRVTAPPSIAAVK